jgi:hypothetical protein
LRTTLFFTQQGQSGSPLNWTHPEPPLPAQVGQPDTQRLFGPHPKLTQSRSLSQKLQLVPLEQ